MADSLRPMGAFYPFLSGRDNLRAVARRCGLGDHRVERGARTMPAPAPQ
jgi:hypothetical protein